MRLFAVPSLLRALTVLAVVTALAGPSMPRAAFAAPASSDGWTTDGQVSPSTVAPGDTVRISASVTSDRSTKALVHVEVYDKAGAKVFQRVWDNQSFQSGRKRVFEATWAVPAQALEDEYVVRVGVFATGWRALRHWNNEAAVFTVATPEPVQGDVSTSNGWTTSGSVSNTAVAPGSALAISVNATSDRSRQALVNLEVYGPGGSKAYQRVWDNEAFTPGDRRTFETTWQVPSDAATGQYVVKVGMFSTGWQSLYHWNDQVSSFELSASSPIPTPTPKPEPTPVSDLPPAPSGWPSTVGLGMSSSPGDAKNMLATAPFGFRYQYLAGGVNTGGGWATWNPDGAFVSNYINESRSADMVPVFSYYMLYQSKPGVDMGEPNGVYANLTNNSTMAAYYRDLKLFFQRAGEARGTTALHVEPDLWAYMQQRAKDGNAATMPVQVGSSGMTDVSGLPDTAAGFAQAIVRLRDRYAPNVVLGYHFSTWGTGNDFIYSDPSDDVVADLGARTAEFYKSLGAEFDVAFTDIADRDAGFKEGIYGDGGQSWFNAADYRRSSVFIKAFVKASGLRAVLWQVPLGNTKMRAMNNSWNHYQDNKVEWLLDEAGRTHLQAYTDAGVIGYLFGAGAGGATCACDANRDGVTNPAPINGNTRTSITADDDGGYFRERAARYYRDGAISLP